MMLSILGIVFLAATLSLLAWRFPLFRNMALGNVKRRPLQAVFAISGLMISSVMITGAFAVGDTLTHSMESRAVNQLGPIAAVGTRSEEGASGYFSDTQVERLDAKLDDSAAVRGIVPTLAKTVTVRHGDQVISGVTLVGLPLEYEAKIGPLGTPPGETSVKELDPYEVYITRRMAATQRVVPGDTVSVSAPGGSQVWKVKAVVDLPGWTGDDLAVILPLDRMQALWDKPGQVNLILAVSEAVDEASLAPGKASDTAASLRQALADPAAVQRLRQFFASEDRVELVRCAYANLPKTSLLYPRAGYLVQALEGPVDSDGLVTYLGEPDVMGWVSGLAWSSADQAELSQVLVSIGEVRVDDIRADSLVMARLEGQNVMSMFLAFSFFSLLAGFMLIFLVISLLVEDRRQEMGTFRAIGAKQRHVAVLLILEASLYALLGSLLGLGLGVALARELVGLLGLGSPLWVEAEFHVMPTSLLQALGISLLLNTVIIWLAAVRSSRVQIVPALRDLPETKPTRAGTVRRILSAIAASGFLLTLAGTGFVVLGHRMQHATPLALGYCSLLVGVLLMLRMIASAIFKPYRGAIDWLTFTLAGVAMLAFWAVPTRILQLLGAGTYQAGIELFLLAGTVEVLGAAWVFRYNMKAFGRLATLPLLVGARRRAVGRLVESALTANAGKMAASTAMVSLITFVLTIMFMVISAMGGLRDHSEMFTRGFDIRVDTSPTAPIADFGQTLAENPALREQVASFGGRTDLPIHIRQKGYGDGWFMYRLSVGDDPYLMSAAKHGGEMILRAEGYASDEAVWKALQERSDVAVITGDAVVVRQRFDLGAQEAPFGLQGFYLEDGHLPQVTVDVKLPGKDESRQMQVIGVVRSAGTEFGVLCGSAAAAGLLPEGIPPSQYYVRVQEGRSPQQVASALNDALEPFYIQTVILEKELDDMLDDVDATNLVLSGYAGLGLLVGVAALGVLSARAVVQRRQQIGMARALGFRRGMVVLAFLLESLVTCVIGLLTGSVLGLALSADLIATVNKVSPIMRLAPPWLTLGLLMVGTFGFTLLVSGVAARLAAGVRPAEALRYE